MDALVVPPYIKPRTHKERERENDVLHHGLLPVTAACCNKVMG